MHGYHEKKNSNTIICLLYKLAICPESLFLSLCITLESAVSCKSADKDREEAALLLLLLRRDHHVLLLLLLGVVSVTVELLRDDPAR